VEESAEEAIDSDTNEEEKNKNIKIEDQNYENVVKSGE